MAQKPTNQMCMTLNPVGWNGNIRQHFSIKNTEHVVSPDPTSLVSPVTTLSQQVASYIRKESMSLISMRAQEESKKEYAYPEQTPLSPQFTFPQNLHELEQKHSDDAVANLINLGMRMGFEKEQCLRALRAASNNADLAVDYLLNGIPQKVQPPKQSEYYQMVLPNGQSEYYQMGPASAKSRALLKELECTARVIATNNSDPSPVFETLRKVAKNLLRNYIKYRTLDATNQSMTKRLCFKGVLYFLRLLGFECDHTRTKLVCEKKPSVRTVKNAVDVLNAQWVCSKVKKVE